MAVFTAIPLWPTLTCLFVGSGLVLKSVSMLATGATAGFKGYTPWFRVMQYVYGLIGLPILAVGIKGIL